MGMGFAPTWLRQVSPLLHKTTLTTGNMSHFTGARETSSANLWIIILSISVDLAVSLHNMGKCAIIASCLGKTITLQLMTSVVFMYRAIYSFSRRVVCAVLLSCVIIRRRASWFAELSHVTCYVNKSVVTADNRLLWIWTADLILTNSAASLSRKCGL